MRLVRGHHAWLASRDAISGADLASALRQVARAQPAAMVEPELAAGEPPAVPLATLRAFAGELERAIRRHHVAFPFRLTTRWHRRDLQVVGTRWVPDSEREVFYSLDVEMPWGRFGALATALQAGEAERVARALVARFRAREAPPPPSGRYPLLLAPGATAVLLHEAVGHALEADLMQDSANGSRSAPDAPPDAAGPAGGRPLLDVLDDPRRAPRGVDRTTDDEGQAVVRRWLIRGGKVDQPISDALHATRSELIPGSGFRGSRHQAPLPRTHHLELLPGEADAATLLGAAEGGLFVPEIDQGTLDPQTGEVVLHAPCGRFVRDGALAGSCGPFRMRSRRAGAPRGGRRGGRRRAGRRGRLVRQGRTAPRSLGDGAVAAPRRDGDRRWTRAGRDPRTFRRRPERRSMKPSPGAEELLADLVRRGFPAAEIFEKSGRSRRFVRETSGREPEAAARMTQAMATEAGWALRAGDRRRSLF